MAGHSGEPEVRILWRGAGDAQRYRCRNLREQLSLLGIEAAVEDLPFGIRRAIGPARLVVLHRVPLDGFLRAEIRRLRARGAVVLADVDDLIFEVEAALEFARLVGDSWLDRQLYRIDLEGHRAMLFEVDGVLAATEFLAHRVRAHGRRAWLHRNAFSTEMLHASQAALRRRRRTGDSVVIGYASGTPTHERDFGTIRPVLRRLLETHPAAELRLVGHISVGHDWGGVRHRVRHVPHVDWRDLPAVLADFDINLAPLEPGRPFCEAKSEVKFLEAALVRVPTVASAAGAYRSAIRNGVTGVLAVGDDDWYIGLEHLIVDEASRQAMGRRAHDEALAGYSPLARAGEFRTILEDLGLRLAGRQRGVAEGAERVRAEAPARPVSRSSHLARAEYTLRYVGLQAFLFRCASFARFRVRGTGGGAGQREASGGSRRD